MSRPMPMRFWMRLVRNNTAGRYVLFIAAMSSLLVVLACQKVQLPEYPPYKHDTDVPRISVEDAKKDVDAGNAVIIDSRGDAAYKVEHIAGSIDFKPTSPDDQFSEIPKGKKIIVYCS